MVEFKLVAQDGESMEAACLRAALNGMDVLSAARVLLDTTFWQDDPRQALAKAIFEIGSPRANHKAPKRIIFDRAEGSKWPSMTEEWD